MTKSLLCLISIVTLPNVEYKLGRNTIIALGDYKAVRKGKPRPKVTDADDWFDMAVAIANTLAS